MVDGDGTSALVEGIPSTEGVVPAVVEGIPSTEDGIYVVVESLVGRIPPMDVVTWAIATNDKHIHYIYIGYSVARLVRIWKLDQIN